MKKGFSLITILAVLIMFTVGAATVLQSVGSHTNMKSNNLQEVKAQYLAEAGMQYALWQCRPANGGCATNPTYSIDGTTVAITATTTVAPAYNILVQVSYTNV